MMRKPEDRHPGVVVTTERLRIENGKPLCAGLEFLRTFPIPEDADNVPLFGKVPGEIEVDHHPAGKAKILDSKINLHTLLPQSVPLLRHKIALGATICKRGLARAKGR